MAKRSFSRLYKIAIGEEKESGLAGRLEHFTHFWFFVGKSFVQNRCLVRASALSYTTLLALIPLLAIAISVTSSLLKKEGEQEIYHAVDKFVSSMVPPAALTVTDAPPQVLVTEPANTNLNLSATNVVVQPADAVKARATVQNVAAERIHEFIHNTRSGALGISGMAVLIFVAISMLNSIESTFNDIWGVERGRNWLMRVARFWVAITLGPLLIAVALSMAGGSHFEGTKIFLLTSPIIGRVLVQFLTLVFIWLVFALLYQFVPNTKVQFEAAVAGAMVAGTLWHLNNVFGFLYVSRVVTNSKIYGGLGLIPVFMAGVYLSWAILLFGAQVAYAYQNRKIYLQEKLIETVSHRDREVLAIRLMTIIGRRFLRGEKPAEIHEISDDLGIPTKLTQQVLQRLLAAQLITEVSHNNSYAPARPLEAINAHDILLSMRVDAGQSLPLPGKPCDAEILTEFEKIENAERTASEPLTLQTLAQCNDDASADNTDTPPANTPLN
jgi:membrane protein